MNEKQIKEGLRKHWFWIRKEDDYKEVAKIIIAFGKRKDSLSQLRRREKNK